MHVAGISFVMVFRTVKQQMEGAKESAAQEAQRYESKVPYRDKLGQD